MNPIITEIVEEFRQNHGEFIEDLMAVGSQTSVNPPPPLAESDIDIIVQLKGEHVIDKFVYSIEEYGYDYPVGHDYDYEHSKDWTGDNMTFLTFRNYDDVNLIVTTSKNFFEKFVLANQTCKFLNLTKKTDRIAVFQAVMYECDPHEYFSVGDGTVETIDILVD